VVSRWQISCQWLDTTIKVWDSQSGELIHTLQGHGDSVNSMVWSPDGKLLISLTDNGELLIWYSDTWRHLESFEFIPAKYTPIGLFFNSYPFPQNSFINHLSEKTVIVNTINLTSYFTNFGGI
jgi:WD40 repeat protein